MKLLIVVFALLVVAYAADIATFTYVNISNNANSQQYKGRICAAGDISVPGIVSAASYSSLSYSGGGGSGTIDGVHGAAFQLIGTSPVASLSYFDINANFQPGSGNQGYNFNVSAAASYIGYLFAGVEEIDGTTGNIVRFEAFKGYLWAITNISAGNSLVPYVTFEGKNVLAPGNTLLVDLTFIIPSSLINLQVVNSNLQTPLSPKSLEILVGIDASKYQYKSQNNFLRLLTFALTGSASFQANVNTGFNGNKGVLSSGSGTAQVNLRFIPTVLVGSNLAASAAAVTVTASSNFTNIDVGSLMAQVQAKYGAQASLWAVTVDFPAGATLLVYDPTMTSGQDPAVSGYSSDSTTVVASVFLLVLCVVISLFF